MHSILCLFVPFYLQFTFVLVLALPNSFNYSLSFADQHILTELEKEKKLSFTPSRQVLGRRYVCHDDRYILNLAAENGGIVVSNDNYRELINEKPKFKEVIEERILMYSFVNDRYVVVCTVQVKYLPTLVIVSVISESFDIYMTAAQL